MAVRVDSRSQRRVPGASGGHPMVVGRIRILAVSLFFNSANEVIVPGFLPI